MVELKLYEVLEKEANLLFVDIVARYEENWVLCRVRERESWECPGGHIEAGETPYEAAVRELWEETGACEFQLRPVSFYGVKGNDGMMESETEIYGQIFYAEIEKLGTLPDFEVEEIQLFDKLPDNWTYPYAHPLFCSLAEKLYEYQKAK
ncbi:MAG: hypothetical protein K0R05_3341 [Anaerocolumna sp.]|nr:hypothetical protein [Anaerocolumna sp.]